MIRQLASAISFFAFSSMAAASDLEVKGPISPVAAPYLGYYMRCLSTQEVADNPDPVLQCSNVRDEVTRAATAALKKAGSDDLLQETRRFEWNLAGADRSVRAAVAKKNTISTKDGNAQN